MKRLALPRSNIKGRYCLVNFDSNKLSTTWVRMLRLHGIRARRKGWSVLAKSTKFARDTLVRLGASFTETDVAHFDSWGTAS